jgi:heme exporter protein D
MFATTDPVAVGVTVLATLAVVGLVASVAYLHRAVRELRREAKALAEEAGQLLEEMGAALRQAGEDVARVERMVGSAEAISEAVGSASRLVGGVVAEPLIKAVALGSGVARAVRTVRRGGPQGRVVTVQLKGQGKGGRVAP